MLLKNQELEMEEKALLVMGMPLRHYLMKYIFPTLTRGLVEVARLRPDDPVDFLVSCDCVISTNRYRRNLANLVLTAEFL